MRLGLCLILLFISACRSALAQTQAPKVSSEGQQCLDCHSNTTPGIVAPWSGSAHASAGTDCYSCHKANANHPAAFDHYGQKIAVIVSPNY